MKGTATAEATAPVSRSLSEINTYLLTLVGRSRAVGAYVRTAFGGGAAGISSWESHRREIIGVCNESTY